MLGLLAFKIGSRLSVGIGSYRGQEGVVVGRQTSRAADAAADERLASLSIWIGTYLVKLDSGVTTQVSSADLWGVDDSEWEQCPTRR